MPENKTMILAKRPSGEPDAGIFDTVVDEIPEPNDGQILLRSLYISVDPYMRNRMNPGAGSYITSFQLGSPMVGDVVAEVAHSKLPGFSLGDRVLGQLNWSEYQLHDGSDLTRIPDGVDPKLYLGLLGLTGLTAYFGLLDVGLPRTGADLVVSGAAGAVGSVAGQIGKMKGCRVVGIAGSDEKVTILKKDLGFDDAINYKTLSNLREELQKTCTEGIDIYFDNVGGSISDNVLYLVNKFARVVLCGQISMYNTTRLPMGPRPNAQLILKRARMQGFNVHDYRDRFQEARKELRRWSEEGKIKVIETVSEGFDKLPEAFLNLFRGKNIGKQMVRIIS